MKKVLLIAILFTVFGLVNSYAFCIYNQTDLPIDAKQVSGGRGIHSFYQVITKNSRECCNWKNKDCNVEGKRNSRVGFRISYEIHYGQENIESKTICNITIAAGGAVVVKGSNGHYQCIGYGY